MKPYFSAKVVSFAFPGQEASVFLLAKIANPAKIAVSVDRRGLKNTAS